MARIAHDLNHLASITLGVLFVQLKRVMLFLHDGHTMYSHNAHELMVTAMFV